jgi:hypothetical protein
MTFDDMERALQAAKSQQQIVDANVHGMAKLIANRLRVAGSMDWKTVDAMRALKRELRDFDSRTGRWKE